MREGYRLCETLAGDSTGASGQKRLLVFCLSLDTVIIERCACLYINRMTDILKEFQ